MLSNRQKAQQVRLLEAMSHIPTVSRKHSFPELREYIRDVLAARPEACEQAEAAYDVVEMFLNDDTEKMSKRMLSALQTMANKKKRLFSIREKQIYGAVVDACQTDDVALTRPEESVKNPKSKDREKDNKKKNAFCIVAEQFNLSPMTVFTYYWSARDRLIKGDSYGRMSKSN